MALVQFIVKDNTGRIVRSGSCDADMVAHQATNQGETAEEGVEDPESEGVITYGYELPRKMSYPSLERQMGAIWKVLAAHPELLDDEARTILEEINAVKAALPKNEQFVQDSSVPNVGFRKV